VWRAVGPRRASGRPLGEVAGGASRGGCVGARRGHGLVPEIVKGAGRRVRARVAGRGRSDRRRRSRGGLATSRHRGAKPRRSSVVLGRRAPVSRRPAPAGRLVGCGVVRVSAGSSPGGSPAFPAGPRCAGGPFGGCGPPAVLRGSVSRRPPGRQTTQRTTSSRRRRSRR
jgi:hypothetical protein